MPEMMLDIEIKSNLNSLSYFHYLAVFLNILHDFEKLKITPEISDKHEETLITGIIQLNFTYKTQENIYTHFIVDFKLNFDFIATPPRHKRLLWDQFHNMKFPESNYIPRDSLTNYDYPYEWHGDHPYTNFFQLFTLIRSQDYFLEILRGSYNCFDGNNYAALLIVDPEEMFHQKEIDKIEYDVIKGGLSLIIFADWFDETMIDRNTFYDSAKFESLKPIVGGANIPALNDLLQPFGIAFGSSVFAGDLQILNKTISYFSGSYLIKFPRSGFLFTFDLFNESDLILSSKNKHKEANKHIPIMGLLKKVYGQENSGKIIVFGDSNCIDSSYLYNDCFDLFKDFLRFVENKEMLIFNEFHDFQLPLDYEDSNEKVIYWNNWKNKQNFLNYSKFSKKNTNFCKKTTLFSEEIFSRMNEMEKQALKIVYDSSGTFDKINRWITNQKIKANYFPEFNFILSSEYIQVVIMVLSISFVIFFLIVLIRRRTIKKYTYSQLANKDPVLLV